MASPAANANGHRRRELRARVLAEETHCVICGAWVDKTLGKISGEHGPNCATPDCPGCAWHPRAAVVDEDIPRVRGGSPTDRANCHLAHRDCNRLKGDRTLAEHAARQQPGAVTTTTLVAW